MEERFEVKPYGVRYRCECGEEMKPTGRVLMSNPPKYPHKCPACGNTENLQKQYPLIEWE